MESKPFVQDDTLGLLVAGGGPAGLGPLLGARGSGQLHDLLDAGLRIVDAGAEPGAGELGRYAIRSDSHADSFLAPAAVTADPPLAAALQGKPGRQLEASRGAPVPLSIAAGFVSDMAREMRDWLSMHRYDPFITGTTVLSAHRQPCGWWRTRCRRSDGSYFSLPSRTLVMATGAAQSRAALAHRMVAGRPLLPRFDDKLILSGELLSHRGDSMLSARLAGHSAPRVVVIGASHSAMSSALRCLQHWDTTGAAGGAVTLLHRQPFRITYRSPEEARAEGYHDFGPEDICCRSGRVYPLAGMRSDSRDLLRRYWRLGGTGPEPRLRLLDLSTCSQDEASHALEQADLIVAAMGYQPRALPLFDEHGACIRLQCEHPGAAMVDHRSRVLDAAGRPVPGVFGLGLSAGYPLAGTHGEPSFSGQANGLSLWHAEIGADIVAQVLAAGPGATALRSAA